mmetsp:Transcript_35194/g.64269  ORF Transcript_35194/g.64269 Transcript_35194/m.64269 type:complete len:858 (-) Transcript_35194:116-2689(-)
MPLRSAQQELLQDLQDWAVDLFGRKHTGRQSKRRKVSIATDEWPSSDLPTQLLAQALDTGDVRRRATHSARDGIREAFAWLPGALAAQWANAAVVAHASTAAVRGLIKGARESPGLWDAMTSGELVGSVAFRAPEAVVAAYRKSRDADLPAEKKQLWSAWSRLPLQDQLGDLAEQLGVGPAAAEGTATVQPPLARSSLRPYQEKAVRAIEVSSPDNCCVVLPCGAGKTRVGAAVAAAFLATANQGACVLILCLRREGVWQFAKELSQNWGLDPFVPDSNKQPGEELRSSRLVILTYHRMLSDQRRARRLQEGDARKDKPSEQDGIGEDGAVDMEMGGAVAARFHAAPTGLLIADECHMVPAPRVGKLLQFLLRPGRRLVGLTATLLREGDKVAISGTGAVPWPLLGACVHHESFTELAPQYLAPVRCVEVRCPVVGEWKALFRAKPLAATVCLSRSKWQVLEHLLAKHAEDLVLVTVERCEQARLIASTFGIIPVDGSMPPTQLQELLERFRRRKIKALVATHVLDDSADIPELSVMIQLGGHFASRRQEQQRLGRLLRWGPIKRQRYNDSGTRPTFYVLVHGGTVEERMSQHRTESVIGVEYERLQATEVLSSACSPLLHSDLFGGSTGSPLTTAMLTEYAAEVKQAAADTQACCLALSHRVAETLPSRRNKGTPEAILVGSTSGSDSPSSSSSTASVSSSFKSLKSVYPLASSSSSSASSSSSSDHVEEAEDGSGRTGSEDAAVQPMQTGSGRVQQEPTAALRHESGALQASLQEEFRDVEVETTCEAESRVDARIGTRPSVEHLTADTVEKRAAQDELASQPSVQSSRSAQKSPKKVFPSLQRTSCTAPIEIAL